MRARIATFVVAIQSILFLAHWFIYKTWTSFEATLDPPGTTGWEAAVMLLSVSFVVASLLAWRYSNVAVRAFYRLSAVWLGLLNFLFMAACLSWLIYLGGGSLGLHLARPTIAAMVFGLALCAGIYGLANAQWTRVKRIKVRLPNLPPSWRGRQAALVSDVHLGHVNGLGFMRRIVSKVRHLRPDIVFITGDLYDGTKVNPGFLAAPWKTISPAFGAYFVTGNHEEFSNPTKYIEGVKDAGVRVLDNEKVVIDGLQVVGVHFAQTTNADRFRAVLKNAGLERDQASILLSHAPHALPIAEEAGISLQLSGHTHGGQIFPFTWFTRRIFGAYTYGLAQFGHLLVYTTTGVGTWGPPMRVGTQPEIVLIEFE